MKITVSFTNKETEAIKEIALELGAKEKQVELAQKSMQESYGTASFKGENGIYDIELGEKLTSFILTKIKGMCKYLKGLVKSLISMIEDMDEVFEDCDKPVFIIEGEDGHEYTRKFMAEDGKSNDE